LHRVVSSNDRLADDDKVFITKVSFDTLDDDLGLGVLGLGLSHFQERSRGNTSGGGNKGKDKGGGKLHSSIGWGED